jgi:redox-sensitive bicupin YhaK (pirin superfamily)
MSIELIIDARRRDLGGFEVGRVLPWTKRRMVGPFIFFDHIGPATFPPSIPQRTDVRPHPHIGLSTITYLFAGEIVHRDSLGCYQVIRPGEVNWMTAGRGISHSERFETMRQHGGLIHGIQAWVALPQADEETDPAFVHVASESLPLRKISGATIRLIAGSAYDATSPVTTLSPLFYAHVDLEGDATIEVPNTMSERAVFVASGRALIDSSTIEAGRMVVLAPQTTVSVRAIGPATIMLLGGEPIGPRHIYWNFVSSRKERIEQAKADWRERRIALPIDDDKEFIPLPEDPPPPPEPMS